MSGPYGYSHLPHSEKEDAIRWCLANGGVLRSNMDNLQKFMDSKKYLKDGWTFDRLQSLLKHHKESLVRAQKSSSSSTSSSTPLPPPERKATIGILPKEAQTLISNSVDSRAQKRSHKRYKRKHTRKASIVVADAVADPNKKTYGHLSDESKDAAKRFCKTLPGGPVIANKAAVDLWIRRSHPEW